VPPTILRAVFVTEAGVEQRVLWWRLPDVAGELDLRALRCRAPAGGTRRYSDDDLERMERITELVRPSGASTWLASPKYWR
jgi:hypothetical protein